MNLSSSGCRAGRAALGCGAGWHYPASSSLSSNGLARSSAPASRPFTDPAVATGGQHQHRGARACAAGQHGEAVESRHHHIQNTRSKLLAVVAAPLPPSSAMVTWKPSRVRNSRQQLGSVRDRHSTRSIRSSGSHSVDFTRQTDGRVKGIISFTRRRKAGF